MLRWILLFTFLASVSSAKDTGVDWIHLQGDKDTAKLLWAPPQWYPELGGFNVKRRTPGGEWQMLNPRPIYPTFYEADLETRTNDPAVLADLAKLRAQVAESSHPKLKPLEDTLLEFANESRYASIKDLALGAYRQALLFGFAYQDSQVPKGGLYEYGVFMVSPQGVEHPAPFAVRSWKWGSRPSLDVTFGPPVIEREPGARHMRVVWPVRHEELVAKQVRHLRVYYDDAAGRKTVWSRNGIDDIRYMKTVRVALQGLVEPGVVSIYVVPVNHFDFEGRPSPVAAYEWEKHRKELEAFDRQPAAIQDATPRPAPPPPPPPAPRVDVGALLAESSLWLDASAGVTLEDRRVAAWRDTSGKGFVATMKDAQRRPTLESMGGGVPAIHFAGGQSLHLERPLEIRSGTLFVIGRNGGDGVRNIILGPVGNNTNNQLRWEGAEKMMLVGPHHGSRIIELPVGDTTVPHVLAVRYDGTNVRFWRNGERPTRQFVFRPPPDDAFTFNSIGSYYSSMYLHGDIAAIIFLPRLLNNVEMQAVDGHLRERYRID